MISGRTRLIAHIGYLTESFKAPVSYDPWREKNGVEPEAPAMAALRRRAAPAIIAVAGRCRGRTSHRPHDGGRR
jgi:hypothetical protein